LEGVLRKDKYSRVGIGTSFLWNASYVLHTMFIPSSCCILVYKLVTFIETRIEFSGNKLVTDGHRLNLNEAPSYSFQKNDRYDLKIKVYKCDVEVEMAQFSNRLKILQTKPTTKIPE